MKPKPLTIKITVVVDLDSDRILYSIPGINPEYFESRMREIKEHTKVKHPAIYSGKLRLHK